MKFILRSITLIFLCLLFTNCGNTKMNNDKVTFEKTTPFKISDGYYQDWIAGVEEGGTGTDVYITMSSMEEGVMLKDIFYKNMKTEISSSPTVKTQYIGNFKNGVKDFIMDSEPMNEANNSIKNRSPFDLMEDQCVISYQHQGKLYYYKIEKLERKETMAYPSSNPNMGNGLKN